MAWLSSAGKWKDCHQHRCFETETNLVSAVLQQDVGVVPVGLVGHAAAVLAAGTWWESRADGWVAVDSGG